MDFDQLVWQGWPSPRAALALQIFIYFSVFFRFSLLNSLFESHSCIRVRRCVSMSVYMYVYVSAYVYEYIVTLVLSTLRKNELLLSTLQIYERYILFPPAVFICPVFSSGISVRITYTYFGCVYIFIYHVHDI